MSLSIWDLFKYLYKWKWFIAFFTAFCFALMSFYINDKQTYTAKAIIEYNDACISQGKTLDGDVFDPNEIKSPAVILNVINELGFENKKIDSIRENISISAITPTTAVNIKEAKEKLGEEYQFYPKTFIITYMGNSSFESTRDILSSVIANYFKNYSENYLYLATLNEVDYNVNKKNFDYIEQIEQIRDNLNNTIESLSSYAKDSAGYRSPTTGLTFDDLLKDFERINEYTVSQIFTTIFEDNITKDKELLVNKYQERIESNEREMEILNYKASLAEDRMKAYLEANREAINVTNSDDSENNGEYVIQDIVRDSGTLTDEKTTYDNLVLNYSNDSIAANDKKLDAEYCKAVIGEFMNPKTTDVNYAEAESEVKEDIEELLTSLSVLYKKANTNINDYNAYIPAMHIKKLSGVGYYENLDGALYKLISIVAGIGISSVLSIAYEVVKLYSEFEFKKKEEEPAEEAKTLV